MIPLPVRNNEQLISTGRGGIRDTQHSLVELDVENKAYLEILSELE